jgi:phospholipid N-methyltransferase
MKGHVFLQQYLKHPRKVGALLPSSGYLAEKMGAR